MTVFTQEYLFSINLLGNAGLKLSKIQKIDTKKAISVDDIFLYDKKMAGAKGLEPSAFCVTGRRYNQLNYAPAFQCL